MVAVTSRGLLAVGCLVALFATPASAARHFEIRVTDRASGQPVPGVQLTTTYEVVYVSDSNGRVAFYEPGLMNTRVYFRVSRSGYQAASDAFGFRGVAFNVIEGGTGTLQLDAVAPDGGVRTVDDAESQLLAGDVPTRAELFRLGFVDAATGRGVPLVEVRYEDRLLVSDSHGLVAFHRPGRMNTDVALRIFSHGYRLGGAEDGALTVRMTPGGGQTVPLERVNLAERLYRVTGQGIYADTAQLGEGAPLSRPVENGLVAGQDSVLTAVHRGRVFWIWGDTLRPAYPLGNFHASGAVSELPGDGGLPPEVGVDLRYFVDDAGFSRAMAPPATVPGTGVTWLWGLASLPVADGGEPELVANYVKSVSLGEETESGLLRYVDAEERFHKVLIHPADLPQRPVGEPVKVRHPDGDYLYFDPALRMHATAEAYFDLAGYEVFTPLTSAGTVERLPDGQPAYAWRHGVRAITEDDVVAGLVPREQALIGHERDFETGDAVRSHGVTTAWNPYRDRYVRILMQVFGRSVLGETWLAEADTPLGPWVYARRIATHHTYTSYNPRQHPFFASAEEPGREVFFEATYTTSFSGAPVPTPRYEYNQVMYRVDLADPRLVLPVAVYALPGGGLGTRAVLKPGMGDRPISFLAPDREGPGLEAVGWNGPSCDPQRRMVRGAEVKETLFFAAPPGTSLHGDAAELFEWKDSTGARSWALEGDSPAGYERQGSAIARAWRNPMKQVLPISGFLPELTANAGEDQCVPEVGGEGQVTLSGSSSTHARGLALSYRWSWGEHAVEGETANLTLPVGVHLVRLEVSSAEGERRTDALLVRVGAAPASCGCGAGGNPAPLLGAAFALLLLRARRRGRHAS